MPVRKIPKNYLGVTGGFSSRKNGRMLGFESLLEKDHFILLEYDEQVASFEEQPVRIPLDRKVKSYVPDVVIHYRPNASKLMKPSLVEVKTTRDLEKNQAKYAPKFSIARKWASDRGWVFKTRSEKDIRGMRLDFLKFLREYHCIDPDPLDIARVRDALSRLGGHASYKTLIDAVAPDEESKLRMIPVVWNLVAIKQLIVDLNQPITDEVLIGLPAGKRKKS